MRYETIVEKIKDLVKNVGEGDGRVFYDRFGTEEHWFETEERDGTEFILTLLPENQMIWSIELVNGKRIDFPYDTKISVLNHVGLILFQSKQQESQIYRVTELTDIWFGI